MMFAAIIESIVEWAYRHARAILLVSYALFGVPLLSLFPMGSIAFSVPTNDVGEFTARTEPPEPSVVAVYAMTMTAAFIVNAFLAACIFGTKDCELFLTTPLTWRLCLRRQLANGWTILASSFLAVPLMVWAAWLGFDLTTMTGGLRWSPIAIADAILAHFAIGFGAIALSVRKPWREFRSATVRPSIILLSCVAVYGSVLLVFAFRREVYSGLRIAADIALQLGTGGEIAIGLVSPASVVALELLYGEPRPAGYILLVFWLSIVGLELRFISRQFRLETFPRSAVLGAMLIDRPSAKPRIETELLENSETRPAVALPQIRNRREQLSWPVWIQHHVVYRMKQSGDAEDDETSHSPEMRFVRTLTHLAVTPRRSSFSGAIAILVYRYPWFFALIFIIGATLVTRPFYGDIEAIAAFTLAGAFIVNLYGGLRWMMPLRVNLALPLRLNRICVRTWKARCWYGLVIDGICAGFLMNTFSWDWTRGVFVVFILQVARICGQIRSWLSVNYGAGRKLGSWLYEAPLMMGPLVILSALSLLEPDTDFKIDAVLLIGAVFWIPYGLLILWIASRDNDSSVMRATSSYRRADPSHESI
jgi:hypothetical protein